MGHILQGQICPIGIHTVEENQVLTRALASFYGTNDFHKLLKLL
jgi:hypothetical protein